MTTFTATNQRVQFYLNYTTERPTTAAKRKRLEMFKDVLQDQGAMLDELFPSKQLAVLDHILFITSGAGIAKVGADKLAKSCNVSRSTVYNAVKALKETGEFIVARLIKSKGGAGKYIFVDKKHANFKEIMREVFAFSDVKFNKQFVEQKMTETFGPVSIKDEKQTSNLNIFFNSKQEKEIYINDMKIIKESIEKERKEPTREYVEQYASNSFQIAFYDVLNSMPYDSSILRIKHVLALRIGSDCDIKRFNVAKKVIHSIAMRINDGYEFNNLVATFTVALENAVNYKNIIDSESKIKYKKPKVTFYNWLDNRD